MVRDAEKSLKKLDIFDDERPVGIQIFGGDPDAMTGSARIVEEAGPNILDINYGCPVKAVVCRNAGAGILKDIPGMIRMTEMIVKSTHLPVTVKTRLGWDEQSIYIEEVVEKLQDVGVRAVSIHARTRHQMYKGRANWEWLGKVKSNPRIHIPVFGNGDVDSPEAAVEMRDKYGVDGIMIGRAAIGYPWIFREIKHFMKTGQHLSPPDSDERVDAAIELLERSMKWKGDRLGIIETRKHYSNYFKGFPGIKEHRLKLVTADSFDEILEILDVIRIKYRGIEIVKEKPTVSSAYE